MCAAASRPIGQLTGPVSVPTFRSELDGKTCDQKVKDLAKRLQDLEKKGIDTPQHFIGVQLIAKEWADLQPQIQAAHLRDPNRDLEDTDTLPIAAQNLADEIKMWVNSGSDDLFNTYVQNLVLRLESTSPDQTNKEIDLLVEEWKKVRQLEKFQSMSQAIYPDDSSSTIEMRVRKAIFTRSLIELDRLKQWCDTRKDRYIIDPRKEEPLTISRLFELSADRIELHIDRLIQMGDHLSTKDKQEFCVAIQALQTSVENHFRNYTKSSKWVALKDVRGFLAEAIEYAKHPASCGRDRALEIIRRAQDVTTSVRESNIDSADQEKLIRITHRLVKPFRVLITPPQAATQPANQPASFGTTLKIVGYGALALGGLYVASKIQEISGSIGENLAFDPEALSSVASGCASVASTVGGVAVRTILATGQGASTVLVEGVTNPAKVLNILTGAAILGVGCRKVAYMAKECLQRRFQRAPVEAPQAPAALPPLPQIN